MKPRHRKQTQFLMWRASATPLLTMMAIKIFFATLLVGLCYASLLPSITQTTEKNGLTLSFPKIPGVNTVEMTYSLRDQDSSLLQVSNSVRVYKNAHGSFTYKVPTEKAFTEKNVLEYAVKYMSANGEVVYHLENAYTIPAASSLSPRLYRRSHIVMYDDFSSNHLDSNKWKHEITCWGGGGGQFQMYTPESANTYIKNGILYLKPTLTADKFGENFLHNGDLDVKKQWGACTYYSDSGCHRQGSKNEIPPIMSSKLYSKASITYGRIEVVAQLPKGDWLWPAIWMLPPTRPWKYGGWPISGEIDIMESRGNVNLKDSGGHDRGVHVAFSTLHWGTSSQHRQQSHSATGTWGDKFHTYAIDWTADHIRTEIDHHTLEVMPTPSHGFFSYSHLSGSNPWAKGGNNAPFDGPMGLILNVAVGATYGYFSDSYHNGNGKPWKDSSHTAMMDFWKNRHQWQSTWHGDDVAMKIRSVKITQY